ITVSAKMGGGDINANPRLRTAVDKALGANMTRDTIDRAVKRGSGDVDGENFDEIRYEGYGPGGVAVMVDCLTDNRNRTVSEVRHAFTKHGGNLGTDGSVSYLFTQTGVLLYPTGSDEDAIMDAALEAGAEDVASDDDGTIEVLTDVESYLDVKQAMVDAGFEPESAELTQRASTMTELDQEGVEKLIKMIDRLEDLDDVQNVYSNVDISDEVMAALGS
ncbi:MAG: YebC/PmpR family DNA-binding transcriptional regulator, partial [Gammaproteobacteria bacterium]|nr:YebC/PmpR family DNA-binding transcriptional regulator [Gammaproteobacteria bacterium]